MEGKPILNNAKHSSAHVIFQILGAFKWLGSPFIRAHVRTPMFEHKYGKYEQLYVISIRFLTLKNFTETLVEYPEHWFSILFQIFIGMKEKGRVLGKSSVIRLHWLPSLSNLITVILSTDKSPIESLQYNPLPGGGGIWKSSFYSRSNTSSVLRPKKESVQWYVVTVQLADSPAEYKENLWFDIVQLPRIMRKKATKSFHVFVLISSLSQKIFWFLAEERRTFLFLIIIVPETSKWSNLRAFQFW